VDISRYGVFYVFLLTAGTSLLTRFQSKLTDIKGQRNAGVAAVARWGDVPARWRWT